ncbi:hypothetical protein GOODEAATRI_026307 [Goodea atripinnis]|uniref:Uncharacterized protein n=1 Tax=Goodea atripinnis TaxID=208336 RepID=A0ABV0PRW5_9TELE
MWDGWWGVYRIKMTAPLHTSHWSGSPHHADRRMGAWKRCGNIMMDTKKERMGADSEGVFWSEWCCHCSKLEFIRRSTLRGVSGAVYVLGGMVRGAVRCSLLQLPHFTEFGHRGDAQVVSCSQVKSADGLHVKAVALQHATRELSREVPAPMVVML